MRRISRIWITVASLAAAGPLACGEAEKRQEPGFALSHAQWEVDVCQGVNTLPSGGTFVSQHDWNDMGVQDETGYTGIDSSNPNDQGVIAAEQQAAAALNGAGCIFGAHGGDPDKCGGQTSVQSLPHDTSQSILYAEYHPECVGRPLILSVCFGGKPGTNGFVSVASAVSENYGVNPSDIIACTGTVVPGVPMQCYGTLVDGNGNPIGNQTVGGLNIQQVRGAPPPGTKARCGPDDPCPTCTPDAGTPDGGPPPPPPPSDAGTPDGGPPPPPPSDAGTSDGGPPPPPPDAGTMDAGYPY